MSAGTLLTIIIYAIGAAAFIGIAFAAWHIIDLLLDLSDD